ncbi:peptidoglycan-binding protein [Acidicapsa dinghuensis]|uniref:Peptidoglycan-binding protein n=1 Tax=Acidicapsa dinghuensis TaxID=2218256 RepID=A0ABW1EDY3_9BACT|nr:peptidoglycan-binding domain-containing protein [Acidicapsa dinghuensis]
MANQSYAVDGLVLQQSADFSQQVQDLQRDLRSLGYVKGPLDGLYGGGTINGVKALQWDLINKDDTALGAPVALKSYNNGSVAQITGAVDQGLVACIGAMLDDGNFPKVPSSNDPHGDNVRTLAAVKAMQNCPVPMPYLLAILQQESSQMHFQVPSRGNIDNFVVSGLDHGDQDNPFRITSRGYGIGQYTLKYHPVKPADVPAFILDPIGNLGTTIAVLQDKFNNEVIGRAGADDRMAEAGSGPLRPCQYTDGDARRLTDCVNCKAAATPLLQITAGTTLWYTGAAANDVYQKTIYHIGSYSNVPDRSKIPCDWAYAVRRYNGSGPDSYSYQAEFLQKLAAQG